MSSLSRVRRALAAVSAVVLVLTLALGVIAWRQVARTMPTTSGSVELAGLAGPVTVLRDERGVPDIYADSMGDLMRAQGYVHAQDRFFEMDLRRHVTAGRLAEMVGEGGVETDKVIRTLGWRRVAQAELPMLESQTRQALQAYADGVNAYIDSAPEISDLALEYTILGQQNPGYRVERWSAVDSLAWLKAMAWDLRGNYSRELTRARLEGVVPRSMIADLYPSYESAANAPILSGDEWSGPRATPGTTTRAKGAPATSSSPAVSPSSASATRPGDAGEVYAAAGRALDAIPSLVGRGDGIGSNSWVVAGSRSSTGKPLLANDPHLGIGIPGIWYQMGLHCRQVSAACPLDVSGFTFSGLPGVVIGHNQSAAWGFTNLDPDVTDFYLEDVDTDARTYRRDGKDVPLTVRPETIKVAGGEDVRIEVRSTVHGPVVSDVMASPAAAGTDVEVDGRPAQTYAVSLAWTALTPSRTADAIMGLNTMTSFEDFREAAKDFAVPSQNLLYAGTDGTIGYQSPGAIPVRGAAPPGATAGEVPSPGWDSRYDWRGFVPVEDLPWTKDPADGVIVTANQQVTARRTPYLTDDWDYGYRSQRIHDLLTAEDKVTPDKMARIQTDTRNDFAPTLVSHLLRIRLDDPFVTEARDLLRTWDYTQPAGRGPSAAAAAYYNAVWSHVLRLTFDDELPSGLEATGGSAQMAAVARLLDKPRSGWWDDKSTPGVVEGRDEVLRTALVQARLELTRTLAKDPSSWEWGKLHQADLEHQVLGGDTVPGPVRALFNRGGYEMAGGSSIVNATSWDASVGYRVTAAPSMRMVVDLGDLDRSRWVNQTGNSGRPFSPHYLDQVEAWRDGELYDWPASREAVEASAEDELELTPATRS